MRLAIISDDTSMKLSIPFNTITSSSSSGGGGRD